LAAQTPAAIRIPLDSGWTLSGQNSQIGDHQGLPAIRLRTGAALRRDVSLQDGTIDFDLHLAPLRAFVYLRFRMASDQEYEEIYLRTHKTNLPDALQYSPVWNGESNWQLYHGPGYTAAAPLPTGRWFRARLVLQGRQAALFLGDTLTPRMIMPLGMAARSGPISFRSFVPGAPQGEPAAAFANVVVRPGYVPWQFQPDSARILPSGLIRRWQISPAIAVEPGLVTAVPAAFRQGQGTWPVFEVEPTGILVIGRHLKRPAPSSAVVARLVLQSRSAALQRLNLGFSDYVTVLVNGQPVFGGDAHYSFDQPRQEGVIGLSQAAVWLPLRPGANEVLLILADGFGGFGVMGQLEPNDGVTIASP
jgi:hypothetical protein